MCTFSWGGVESSKAKNRQIVETKTKKQKNHFLNPVEILVFVFLSSHHTHTRTRTRTRTRTHTHTPNLTFCQVSTITQTLPFSIICGISFSRICLSPLFHIDFSIGIDSMTNIYVRSFGVILCLRASVLCRDFYVLK